MELFDTIPSGISITFDKTCREIRHNKKAAEFLRIQSWEVLSHTASNNLPLKMYHGGKELSPEEMPVQRAVWEGETVKDLEIDLVWEDGIHKTAMWNSNPLVDENGMIIGAIAAFKDITGRKRVENELRIVNSNLAASQEIAHIGSFFWDLEINRLVLSDELYRILGLTPGQIQPSYQALINLIHPEDRKKAVRKILRSIRGGKNAPNEFRIVKSDGAVKFIEVVSRVAKGSGKPELIIGAVQDITKQKLAEETLRETRDYLENLIAYANAPIIVWDTSFKITKFNHAFERLTGYTEDEVLGRSLDILFPENSKRESLNHIRQTSSGERWEAVEIPILGADGSIHTVLWNSANIWDKDKTGIIATIAQGQDITRRKEAEEAVRSNRTLLFNIIDGTSDPIYVKDLESRMLLANRAMAKLAGKPFNEIIGYTAGEYYGHKTGQLIRENDLKIITSGKSEIIEETIPTTDGDRIFLANKFPYRNELGEIIGVIGISRDITERKKAEVALKKSEERYRSLAKKLQEVDLLQSEERFCKAFHSSPAMMYIQNLDGRFIEINDKFMEVSGFSRDEIIGRNSMEINIYIDPAQRVEIFQIIKESGRLQNFEIKARNKNGKILNLVISAEIVQLNNERVILYHLFDITERKRAEDELQKSRREIIDILARITDNFVAFDKNWRCTYINKAAELYLLHSGIDAKELLGRVFWEARPETVGTIFYCEYHKAMAEQKSVTFEARCTITGKWIEVSAYPSPDGLSVYFRDTGERKRMQDSLREKEEQLRQITDNMMDVIMKIDTEGVVQYVSPSYTNLTGYSYKHKLGRSCFENMHPDDAERIISGFEPVVKAGRKEGTFEFRYGTADGRCLWLESSVKALFDDMDTFEGAVLGIRDISQRKQMEEKLRQSEERFFKAFNSSPVMMNIRTLNGKCIDVNDTFIINLGYSKEEVIGTTYGEHHIYGSSGPPPELIKSMHEKKPINNLEVKIYAKQGAQHIGLLSTEFIELNGETCILIIINDITELKQFEKEMSRLDRLSLVGEMAGGIAHEIRNPMTSVRGYLQFLVEKTEFKKYLDRFQLMISELDRANSIITEYLTLARSRAYDAKAENLNILIKELIYLIETDAIKEDKYINLELEEVPDLLLEKNDIKQMILNLIRNGLEAMAPGGYLTLRTSAEGEEVVLAVSDQGKGIPPEHLDKMGIPFFTTKDYGTGLGLAMCYKIAARHNAEINIETSPEGTTFFVKFDIPGASAAPRG